MNRKNLANAELASAITDSATSITVKAGQGALLPVVPFYATITPLGVLSTLSNSEIVKVTAVSTDTLTVVRARRGTTAKAFAANDIIGNGSYAEDHDIKVTTSTAVSTAAKVGTTTAGGHIPEAGQRYIVTFTNGNTAASPTLNIDGAGAFPIQLGNTAASATTFSVTGSIDVPLYFNGTSFKMYGSYRTTDTDTTYNAPVSSWVNVSGTTQTAAVNTGYNANNAARVTVTLPATAAVGQIVAVAGVGAGGFRLQAPAGDNILINGTSTSTAGYIDGSQNDYIEVRCTVASTTWVVTDFQGSTMKTDLGYMAEKVIIAQASAPTDTSKLWYDTDEATTFAGGDAVTLNGRPSSTTPAANTILPLDSNALAIVPMKTQSDTTNSTKNTRIQTGWGQIYGSGTTGMSEAVTFPLPFSSAPSSVQVTSLGYKTPSSIAANIGEFNTGAGNMLAPQAINITTTGFTIQFQGTSNFGGAYHGYSWTAIGE